MQPRRFALPLLVLGSLALSASRTGMRVPADLMNGQVVVPLSDLQADGTRRIRLRALFHRITASATTPQEKVEAFVSYIQDHVFHPIETPQDTDGTAIYDPIWIIDHQIGLRPDESRAGGRL